MKKILLLLKIKIKNNYDVTRKQKIELKEFQKKI